MSGDWWVIIVAALPVLGLLGFAVVRGRGGDDEHDSLGAAEEDRPVPAIVANPTKADPDTRRLVSTVCTSLGWAEPLWLETTVEDPGTGQAREADRAGRGRGAGLRGRRHGPLGRGGAGRHRGGDGPGAGRHREPAGPHDRHPGGD